MPVHPIFKFPFLREHSLNVVTATTGSVKAADYMRAYQSVADCEGLIVVLRWLNC